MGAQDLDVADLLLPERARLLHIGPHKTGTTALQDAFVLARHQLAEHGVFFPPNSQRQPMRAALAVTDRIGLRGEAPAKPWHWDRFVRRVGSAPDKRVVISSEFFADATDEQAATVVEGLEAQRLHLVVTLRPLSKILPSQWQQYVQNGAVTSYERWLRGMLLEPPYDNPNPSFWQRHDHPRLIERWAKHVGHDRVTVIVVNESDRTMLLRVFESLLGLPDGLLCLDDEVANRSLTWGEVELLRLLNEEFKQQEWPDSYYARFLRYGGVERVRTHHQPMALEPRIATPAWAEERAAEIGQRFADDIGSMGVRVIGDLSSLANTPTGSAATVPDPILSASAAAEIVVGTIVASAQQPTEAKSDASAQQPTEGKGGAGSAPGSSSAPGSDSPGSSSTPDSDSPGSSSASGDSEAAAPAGANGSNGAPTAASAKPDTSKAGSNGANSAAGAPDEIRQPPKKAAAERPTRVEERLVANVRTKQLLRVVAKRVRRRVKKLFRRAAGQRPGSTAAAPATRSATPPEETNPETTTQEATTPELTAPEATTPELTTGSSEAG